jgi:predicted nucleic acid-binding protein
MASAVRKHYSDSAQTNGNGVRLYLDTSALVKLIVAESESTALTDYLQRFAADDLFTAALARTELVRAVVDGGPPAITQARAVLDSIDTVALSRAVLDDAATLPPPLLRTLDAIHLAAAQRAGTSLRAVVTYDGRMVEAAAALGMPHVSPM